MATSRFLEYADSMWTTAAVPRRHVDASEYKEVVLRHFFLKYISHALELGRPHLTVANEFCRAQFERPLESGEEYTLKGALRDLVARSRFDRTQKEARDTLGRSVSNFPGISPHAEEDENAQD